MSKWEENMGLNIKKGVAVLALAGAALVLTPFGSDAQAAEIEIKFANVMAPSHDTSKAVDKFAELVETKSDGRITVQHFPGAQLGSDKETYEAAQQGMLQIAGGSFANLVTITRAFEVLHLPFIFEERAQAHRALDSQKVKDLINDQLADVGFVWLLTFEYGFRDINTTERQVSVPDDMSGLKLRASRSPTEIAGVEAFGASAVTIDWPEVYNALRFGVVDGEAQPYGTLVSAKHEEVLKQHLDIDWQFYAFVGMISLDQWQSYPDWAQEIILESAQEAEQYHRKIWVEEDDKAKAVYQAAGGEITVPDAEQRALWVDAGRSTWAGSGVPQEEIDLVQSAAKGN